MTTDDKVAIIDEICKFHPIYGVEEGWSYYRGGMMDTGEWFFRKMLYVPGNQLKDFLGQLKSIKNRPFELLSEEEIAEAHIGPEMKEITIRGVKYFYSEAEVGMLDRFMEQKKRFLRKFWGI